MRQLGIDTSLLAVADGLGGQPGGEEAAQLVMDTLASFSPHGTNILPQLERLILTANEAVIREGDRNSPLYGMGCTATIVLLQGTAAYWVHIGDSRCYHYHAGHLTQITVDQNLAGEMVAQGEISAAESVGHPLRNFLSQCMGEDGIEPTSGFFTLAPGDVLLLCTDGIHGMLPPEEIATILAGKESLAERAEGLKNRALQAGGIDNISLILVE